MTDTRTRTALREDFSNCGSFFLCCFFCGSNFVGGGYGGYHLVKLVGKISSRGSYVCKAGLGDVMLGAAATVADYNGVAKASHIKALTSRDIFYG